MSAGPHISISAETVTHFIGIPVSNSMIASVVVSAFLVIFAIIVRKKLNTKDIYGRPGAFQNFSEMIVESLYELVDSVTHNKKKSKVFLPFIASFFLWILLNNWFGLFPGVGTIGINHEPIEASLPVTQAQASEVVADEHGEETVANENDSERVADEVEESEHEEKTFIPIFRAGTADLNTTIALAIISVVVTQIIGFKYLSIGYLKKYFDFSNPLMFFVGILELILEFAKIISFAFRLFGNIFAGEVLIAVILFLVPVIAPMPFYGLEIFVGFIQALVFSMLSLVFFNMATISHDEH